LRCTTPKYVHLTRRVAKITAEEGQHRLNNPRITRCRGIVIEVDYGVAVFHIPHMLISDRLGNQDHRQDLFLPRRRLGRDSSGADACALALGALRVRDVSVLSAPGAEGRQDSPTQSM